MLQATSLYVRCLGLFATVVSVIWSLPVPAQVQPSQQTAPSAQPYEVRGSERRLLARFQNKIQSAQWEEALDLADEILASNSTAVVTLEESHYVSVQDYCHRLLAKLPTEVLAEYRALVDAPAAKWYQEGIKNRDVRLLQRVLDEAFCSSWGDESLDALAELALERGDYLAARNYWRRVSDGLGKSTNLPQLTYPDTNLDLAGIGARLVLVSIREGNLNRAKDELEEFKTQFPSSRGQFGGRQVLYSEALTSLLAEAVTWPAHRMTADWPTYAGSHVRQNYSHDNSSLNLQQVWSHRLEEHDNQQLNLFPVVIGKYLIYQGMSKVYALDIESGKTIFTTTGSAFESFGDTEEMQSPVDHTLSATNRFVFGTTIRSIEDTQRLGGQIESTLWSLDLNRDGAIHLRKQLNEKDEGFAGAPLIVDSQLWVVIRDTNNPVRIGIACYDLATDQLLWKNWLTRTRISGPASLKQWTNNLLTYHSGTIFCCTNTGAIAALRASDGKIHWICNYERSRSQFMVDNNLANYRLPNPIVFDQGTLFIAPQDSDKILALRADTGENLWQRESNSLVSEIVGLANGKLVVSERGLVLLNISSEEPTTVAAHANLGLHGQPAIVEDFLFWPTDNQIEIIDLQSGNILQHENVWEESGAANLIIAKNYLIAAGRTKLTAYRILADTDTANSK